MKKLYAMIVLAVFFTISIGQAQTALIENFDYPVGDTLGSHGWDWHSGTGTPFTVIAGNLVYPGYSAGIGNSTIISGGAGSREDSHFLFTSVDTTGSYYAAILVNVDTAVTTGDYFFHFSTNPHASTAYRARLFVKADGLGGFQFGLSKASTSTVTYSTASYVFGTTYLLVIKYAYVNVAANDDIVTLYINPDPTQPEPGSADITATDVATDISLGAMDIRQGSQVYTVQIDAITLINSWNAIVPVELTSFSGSVNNKNVNLSWTTATEINNQGFDIERKSSNTTWQTIGFVNGRGTTTEQQQYSYLDKNLTEGKYSYRLKQIDFNGSYEYSNIIEAIVITPSKFELSQNYPNPFNPSTAITFALPQAGNVKLAVYNLLGQEVQILVNGFKSEGTHTVNFEAKNLNSGIYLYKLEANGISSVRKMTLIK
jgi:hypothetical protein